MRQAETTLQFSDTGTLLAFPPGSQEPASGCSHTNVIFGWRGENKIST